MAVHTYSLRLYCGAWYQQELSMGRGSEDRGPLSMSEEKWSLEGVGPWVQRTEDGIPWEKGRHPTHKAVCSTPGSASQAPRWYRLASAFQATHSLSENQQEGDAGRSPPSAKPARHETTAVSGSTLQREACAPQHGDEARRGRQSLCGSGQVPCLLATL